MHGWSLGSKEPALPFMLRSHSIPCFKGPRIPNAQGCCIILAAVCVSVLTPVPLSFVHNVTVNWTSQTQARAHAPSAGMVQRTKGRSASCPVRLKRQLAMSPGVRTHSPRLIKLPAPLDLSDNLSQNVILDCPSCGSRLIWVLVTSFLGLTWEPDIWGGQAVRPQCRGHCHSVAARAQDLIDRDVVFLDCGLRITDASWCMTILIEIEKTA